MNDRGRWRAAELGERGEVQTGLGPIRYFSAGEGPVVVLIHGLLVNANLWRKVVPRRLSPGLRCRALELPLGSHERPAKPGAESPRRHGGRGDRRGDRGARAGGRDARGQRHRRRALPDAGHHQARAHRAPGAHLVRLPRQVPARGCSPTSSCWRGCRARSRRCSPRCGCASPRRLPLAFGWLVKRPIDRDAEDSYILPRAHRPRGAPRPEALARGDRQARHPTGGRPARRVRQAGADRVVEARTAVQARARRARWRRTCRTRGWSGSRTRCTFSMEDSPSALAELIAGFVREPVRPPRERRGGLRRALQRAWARGPATRWPRS